MMWVVLVINDRKPVEVIGPFASYPRAAYYCTELAPKGIVLQVTPPMAGWSWDASIERKLYREGH
jgi:hypothetical protein